jgi:hypothetical protein
MNRLRNVRALSAAFGAFVLCFGARVHGVQTQRSAPAPPPAPVQPIPYSHRLHAGDLGLDCTECHENPGQGRLMTYPPSSTCTSCHRTNTGGSESLQKLIALSALPRPIPWVRVYRLPDFVYWSHASHLAAKVTCVECHGPVATREEIALETDVTTMTGCQRCHERRQVLMDCGDCHEPRQ